MKIITMSRIGYNHPIQANWSYNIWKIDLINTDQPYNMSYTVKETFGGDSRLRDSLDALNIAILETKAVYTSTGTQKITGIGQLMDIEGAKLLEIIKEFNNK